jgi:hypothetical protein
MTDQTANQLNSQPPETGSQPAQVQSSSSMPKFTSGVIKTIMLNLWKKFYANKKIFWPVTIFFGLVLLIIILGLIFGRKPKQTPILPQATEKPFILSTPIASPSAGILGESNQKLIDLKTQIDNLDVKQSKLKPPILNFEVRF